MTGQLVHAAHHESMRGEAIRVLYPSYQGDIIELSRQRVSVRQGRYQGAKGTLVGYIDARRTTACVVRLDDGRDVVIGASQADIY